MNDEAGGALNACHMAAITLSKVSLDGEDFVGSFNSHSRHQKRVGAGAFLIEMYDHFVAGQFFDRLR